MKKQYIIPELDVVTIGIQPIMSASNPKVSNTEYQEGDPTLSPYFFGDDEYEEDDY